MKPVTAAMLGGFCGAAVSNIWFALWLIFRVNSDCAGG